MEVLRMTLLGVVLVLSIAKQGTATQHVVGGSQGWDESTDFDSWANGQTFKVGDTLVFKYTSGLHSVLELGSESEYKKCDVSNAANSMNGGNDVVKLNKAGTRYFACGTSGHCSAGMKLKVNIVTASSTPSSTGSSPSSSLSTSSSSSTSRSTNNVHKLLYSFSVMALVALFAL